MLEPVGPLPPVVYWRRRIVALLGVVLCLVLLGWVISRIASAGTAGSAAPLTSAAPVSVDDGSQVTSPGSDLLETSLTAPATTTAQQPAPTTEPAPTTDPAPPPPPAAPPVCANEQILVTVGASPPTIGVGQKPDFVLNIQNTGPDCFRDLDAAGQEIRIYDQAGTRLWGSNDCYPEKSDDFQLLTTGQTVSYAVRWSSKVSEPTCTAPRPVLGAGSYLLEGVQGGVVSQRVQFIIQ